MNRPDHGAILLPFIGGAFIWAAHSFLLGIAALAVLFCIHWMTGRLEGRNALSWKMSDNLRMLAFLATCFLAFIHI